MKYKILGAHELKRTLKMFKIEKGKKKTTCQVKC